ncbi:hypothetical protein CHARACLAT_022361 [Characodon lateralis]|uniref:Uncharacterized protein n=1 Tax=Characodon lateralis TaxID=208331 RepID=A0ABU7DJD7_9TELE|nr:hypothetical protein [Characodon lateralis]
MPWYSVSTLLDHAESTSEKDTRFSLPPITNLLETENHSPFRSLTCLSTIHLMLETLSEKEPGDRERYRFFHRITPPAKLSLSGQIHPPWNIQLQVRHAQSDCPQIPG